MPTGTRPKGNDIVVRIPRPSVRGTARTVTRLAVFGGMICATVSGTAAFGFGVDHSAAEIAHYAGLIAGTVGGAAWLSFVDARR